MGRLRFGAALFGMLAVCLFAFTALAAGQAEMRIDAPSGSQSIGTPFVATVSITRADVTWGGYNTNIAYDRNVLKVNSVTRGGIADCNDNSWGNPRNVPAIVAACAFQTTKATGVTEKIEFQCLKNGSSELHLITPSEDTIEPQSLFDESGVLIPTDLIDSSVTCGSGGPLATVPIPTNPTQSELQTEEAKGPSSPVPTVPSNGTPAPSSGTPGPSSGTPGASSGTPGASSGTPGASGGTARPNTSPGAQTSTAARTGTAASSSRTPSRTGTPTTGSTSSGSGGSSSRTGWVIGIIVGVGVVIAAGAGGAMWWRSRP